MSATDTDHTGLLATGTDHPGLSATDTDHPVLSATDTDHPVLSATDTHVQTKYHGQVLVTVKMVAVQRGTKPQTPAEGAEVNHDVEQATVTRCPCAAIAVPRLSEFPMS